MRGRCYVIVRQLVRTHECPSEAHVCCHARRCTGKGEKEPTSTTTLLAIGICECLANRPLISALRPPIPQLIRILILVVLCSAKANRVSMLLWMLCLPAKHCYCHLRACLIASVESGLERAFGAHHLH